MKLNYIFFMNRAILDSATKKWTFVDVFNAITIPKSIDYVIENFYIAALVKELKLTKDSHAEIKLFDPDNKEIASAAFAGPIQQLNVQYTAPFRLVKIDKTGKYLVHLYIDNELVKDDNRYYVEVQKAA